VSLLRLMPVGIRFVSRLRIVGCNIRNPPLTRVGMRENLTPVGIRFVSRLRFVGCNIRTHR